MRCFYRSCVIFKCSFSFGISQDIIWDKRSISSFLKKSSLIRDSSSCWFKEVISAESKYDNTAFKYFCISFVSYDFIFFSSGM